MLDRSRGPGYNQIAAVHSLSPEHPAWLSLTEGTLKLPAWMVPAVIGAVRHNSWRTASFPIRSLRESAVRLAGRMELKKANYFPAQNSGAN